MPVEPPTHTIGGTSMSKSRGGLAYVLVVVVGILIHTFIVQWQLTERARLDGAYHLQMVEAATGKAPVDITVDDKTTRFEESKVPDAGTAFGGLLRPQAIVPKP
jgi:hypothetical protein